jgi:uncharacterized RDD family membrane protein YckC
MTTTGALYAGELTNVPDFGPGAPADWVARGVAYVIDAALVYLPWVLGRPLVGLATFVLYVGGHWLFGVTPGKWLARLRVYAVDDGKALYEQRGLTLVTAVMRMTMVLFGPYLLFALLTTDGDRRTVYDRIARTVVLSR